MAVNVIEYPSGMYCLSDCMNVELALSGVSSETETKTLEWQVWCTGDNGSVQLQSIQSYEPVSVSDTVRFNLASLVACAIECLPPRLQISLSNTQDGFKKDIFVKYREVTVNKEDCSIDEPAFTDGASFEVIGAKFQVFQAKGSLPLFLTDKKVVTVCRDSYDWIRVCGSGTAVITYFHIDGTTTNSNLGVNDNLMPSGPANLLLPTTVCKYTIELNGNKVTYVIGNCCCDEGERIDIYFLEPKGSWSVMTFECVLQETISREFATVCNEVCSTDPYDIISKYGRSIVNKRKWMSFNLRRRTKDNKEYRRAFANADKYYAVYRCGDYDQYMAPLIPSSTIIQTDADAVYTNISFSAIYGQDLK